MIKILVVIIIIVGLAAAALAYRYGLILNPTPTAPPPQKSVYEFTMKDIDGNDVSLDTYRGKVAMIVNVASKCGYTPQYEGLESIYEKYKDRGFVVLGFPANNFLGQEPGTEADIKEFCRLTYGVSFPMFSKISVTGSDQHPLYTMLTSKQSNPEFGGDITWNFNKFLLDKTGRVAARFGTKDIPESDVVTTAIEKSLAAD
ncbi:MAG: glutathione peroxidase [Pyrinomonadaceae bacterium]|nr:glutathione peroxidase [Pyrinomonadaceae bacterium]